MTTAHRFVSLSILGVMALSLAPLASAQGFGGRGHMGIGNTDIDAGTRAEIRAELETCKQEHSDDRDAMKACADAVFTEHNLGRSEHPEPEDRPEIPEEAHDELEDCRDENEGNPEAAKACADAVFEAYGIEKPQMHPQGRGRGMKMGHRFRSSIEETCGERENTDEWRSCAKEQRSSVREDVQENHPRAFGRFRAHQEARSGGLFGSSDLRAELKACLDLDNQNQLRECVFGVRAEARANAGN